MKPRRQGQARTPCILDLQTAQRLVDLAAKLPDRNTAPLRGPAYSTIFSLLFGLGLRVGEVARLRWRDVDCDRDVLTIRDTKFSKSRLIPMGPRLAQRLHAFMDKRLERLAEASGDTPLFSFMGGRPVNPGTISLMFRSLAPHLNIAVPPGGTLPHVHDLRHSFAVGTTAPMVSRRTTIRLTSWSSCRPSWDTWIPRRPRFISRSPPISWMPPVSASSALPRRYQVEASHDDRR